MKRTMILAAIVAALVLLIVTVGPAACNRIRSLMAQGRMNEGQHGALVNSAGDSIATQGNVASNAQVSEDLTERNREVIRHAKGADATVDPDVRDAGFASLCKRASFRNSPTGRVRCPAASGVVRGR